ncbi:MAG: tyrosine-type recombinase/integrase [Candidatus Ozemobacteraceae bacterium]
MRHRRHTTAMSLLQSGVELNVIRDWLGHASLETTNQYAQIDLEMKTRAMERCESLVPKGQDDSRKPPEWKTNPDILVWLALL